MIEVVDLVKHYRASDGSVVRAVDGVSLAVAPGEMVGLLGANGAGKTTTLRAICNMVRTEGSIRFAGQDIIGRPTEEIVRQRIAHVPEGRGTFTTLTVDENLRIAAYTRRDNQGVEQERERVHRVVGA